MGYLSGPTTKEGRHVAWFQCALCDTSGTAPRQHDATRALRTHYMTRHYREDGGAPAAAPAYAARLDADTRQITDQAPAPVPSLFDTAVA